MPKTLSMDLRERIVRHVREGHSRRSAAAKFAVSASSAVRIVARQLATGSVAPKVGRWAGARSWICSVTIWSGGSPRLPTSPCRSWRRSLRRGASGSIRPTCRAGSSGTATASKKPCWPASKIALTSARRASTGSTSDSQECDGGRTGSSSSTKPERPPR